MGAATADLTDINDLPQPDREVLYHADLLDDTPDRAALTARAQTRIDEQIDIYNSFAEVLHDKADMRWSVMMDRDHGEGSRVLLVGSYWLWPDGFNHVHELP